MLSVGFLRWWNKASPGLCSKSGFYPRANILELGFEPADKLAWVQYLTLYTKVAFLFFKNLLLLYFKILFIYFLERGERREKERERNINVQLPGDLAHNPGMCPDWELNW